MSQVINNSTELSFPPRIEERREISPTDARANEAAQSVWSLIPPEIQGQILSELPSEKHPRVQTVCRTWRTLYSSTPALRLGLWISLAPKVAQLANNSMYTRRFLLVVAERAANREQSRYVLTHFVEKLFQELKEDIHLRCPPFVPILKVIDTLKDIDPDEAKKYLSRLKQLAAGFDEELSEIAMLLAEIDIDLAVETVALIRNPQEKIPTTFLVQQFKAGKDLEKISQVLSEAKEAVMALENRDIHFKYLLKIASREIEAGLWEKARHTLRLARENLPIFTYGSFGAAYELFTLESKMDPALALEAVQPAKTEVLASSEWAMPNRLSAIGQQEGLLRPSFAESTIDTLLEKYQAEEHEDRALAVIAIIKAALAVSASGSERRDHLAGALQAAVAIQENSDRTLFEIFKLLLEHDDEQNARKAASYIQGPFFKHFALFLLKEEFSSVI